MRRGGWALRLVFLNGYVGVARNAKDGFRVYGAPPRQRPGVIEDDLFQRCHARPIFGRHRDETGKQGRNRNGNELLIGRVALRYAHRKSHEKLQIRKQRARIELLHRQRRQDRQHLGREIFRQKLTLLRRPPLSAHEMEIVRGEFLEHLGDTGRLLGQHLPHLPADERELLRGCQSAGVALAHARGLLLLQTRHADHEELVQVRADNRKELEPLAQRQSIGPALLQDPVVELEPAQFAIDEEIGHVEILLCHSLSQLSLGLGFSARDGPGALRHLKGAAPAPGERQIRRYPATYLPFPAATGFRTSGPSLLPRR